MAQRKTTTARYSVARAFDYLTAGREYDFTVCGKKTVDVRRADGSGIGTYIQAWQFRRALSDGSLQQAPGL